MQRSIQLVAGKRLCLHQVVLQLALIGAALVGGDLIQLALGMTGRIGGQCFQYLAIAVAKLELHTLQRLFGILVNLVQDHLALGRVVLHGNGLHLAGILDASGSLPYTGTFSRG